MEVRWLDWWWVLVFCTLCAVVYFPIAQSKQKQIRALAYKLEQMDREQCWASSQKEDFCLQLASQTDPSWIEMILMRDLGVVPEGWLKVHFKK